VCAFRLTERPDRFFFSGAYVFRSFRSRTPTSDPAFGGFHDIPQDRGRPVSSYTYASAPTRNANLTSLLTLAILGNLGHPHMPSKMTAFAFGLASRQPL